MNASPVRHKVKAKFVAKVAALSISLALCHSNLRRPKALRTCSAVTGAGPYQKRRVRDRIAPGLSRSAPRQAIDEIFVLFCLQRRSAFRPHVPITYRQTVLNGVMDSILIYKEEHPSAMVSDRDSRHDPPNAFNMRACNSSSSPTMFATTVTGEKYILRTVCTKSCKPCAHARIENVRMNLLSI